MIFTTYSSQRTGNHLRTVTVQRMQTLALNEEERDQIVVQLPLDVYSDGRAFLAFDDGEPLNERFGIWMDKDLDRVLAEAKARYLKARAGNLVPRSLQIVVARDDEDTRYVSVSYSDRGDEGTYMSPELIWDGDTGPLELECWDEDHGYVVCFA